MSDEFLATLPEEMRGEEALKDVEDVGGLATKFLEASKKEYDWRNDVPEDLKDDPSLKDILDIAGLAKNYVNTKKMVGDGIRVPEEGDENAQEKLNEIYTKLGRPAEAKDYEAQMPGGEDGPSWDEDSVNAFKDVAHAAGLNNAQTQAVMDFYGGTVETGLKAQQEELSAAVESLKKDWGTNYNRNMAYVMQSIEKLGGNELKAELDGNSLGNSPLLTKFIYQFARNLAEDGIIPGEVAGVIGKEDAKSKIAEIRSDPKHAYFNPDMPGHKEATEEMYRLNQILTGGEKEEAPVSVSA